VQIANEVTARAQKYGANNPQQREHLLQRLRDLPASIVVPELLSVFEKAGDPDASFNEQELAGYLLWHGPHIYPVSPSDVIRASLHGWNLSVEELPWYMCRVAGIEAVSASIERLLCESPSPAEEKALKAMAFWVRNYAH
jgi:hypothetical protein